MVVLVIVGVKVLVLVIVVKSVEKRVVKDPEMVVTIDVKIVVGSTVSVSDCVRVCVTTHICAAGVETLKF
jgi:hypothetical protein